MTSKSLDSDYSLTLATTPPLSSRDISLRLFLDGRKEGVHHAINAPEDPAFSVHPAKIISFARTANGTGLAILRDDVVESYSTDGGSLKRIAHWRYGDLVVVFDQGIGAVLCTSPMLTRRHRALHCHLLDSHLDAFIEHGLVCDYANSQSSNHKLFVRIASRRQRHYDNRRHSQLVSRAYQLFITGAGIA